MEEKKMTILELSEQLRTGRLTCTALTKACLAAIAENDQSGRGLNSVAEIDPDALFAARQIDEEIRQNGPKSPLHGIPVLIKDNVDVKGLHTTAGSLALADLIAKEDAPLTAKLREAGALILGKANLSEFAYFMSNEGAPSGYSSRGGQVVHAYVPEINPSGSSSGSAVAVSARLVPAAIGTETDGSLMSPSSVNSICTIKPTVGLVSRRGIIPISHVQDTAGPMATNVTDLALVLQVIAGPDEGDAATLNCKVRDYAAALKTDCGGLRIGICRKDCGEEALAALDRAERILKEAGAQVVEVPFADTRLQDWEAFPWEFKAGIDRYLAQHDCSCRSLGDIIAYNKAHREECLRYGQGLLEASEAAGDGLKAGEYLTRRLALEEESHRLLDGTMEEYGVDCLLSAGKFQKGNLAPVSGGPCLSLPAVKVTEEHYEPVNYQLYGRPYSEVTLLHAAYALEQALGIENRPAWVKMPF